MTTQPFEHTRQHAHALDLSARRLAQAASLGFASAARDAVRSVHDSLGHGCCVNLVNDDGTVLELVAQHGDLPPRLLGSTAMDADAPFVRAARARSADCLETAEGDHSVLVAPILLGPGAVGIVCIVRRNHGFDRDDRHFATALAACAALALHAARDAEARRAAEQARDLAVEREVAARDAVSAAAELRDDFLATVSHELRTPLNAIIGWVHILGAGSPSPELLARAVQIIKRNAEAQARLVSDLLDVGSIVGGRVVMAAGRIDVEDVAHAAVAAVGLAARAKEIQVSLAIDGPLPFVLGDRNRLQQVLWHLLSNAVKFSGKRGRVALHATSVAATVRITVTDDGQGITRQALLRIFAPFHQADSTMVRVHGGLGLGLSLVKNLVEMHGGSITAQSDGPGRGATFVVDLPAAPAAVLPDPLPGRPAFDLRGVSVLLLNGPSGTLEPERLALVAQGAVVTSVAGLDPTLEELTSGAHYDVLLAEVDAPGVDALDTIRNVRTLSPERGGTIPSVAMSRLATADARVRALSAGFDHHATRPMHPSDVGGVILAALGRGAVGRS